MKKIFILVIVVSICNLFTFCDKKKINEEIVTLKISDNNFQHKIKFSELIKDYKFIPLETNKENIFGKIDKILFNKNQIYILDHLKAKAIFVFSLEGNYLWKISKFGRGPGEYLELLDFCFEPKTDNLVLSNIKDLIFYDSKGVYIKTIKLPFSAYKIEYSDDNHVACVNGGIGDFLLIIDTNGNESSSYFNYTKETRLILQSPLIRNDKSDLLYVPNLDYTIYKVNGDKISPYVKFDFSKDMYSPQDLKLLKDKKSNINNFYHIMGFFEGPINIFLPYFYKKNLYYFVYNKETKVSKLINANEIDNDITYGKSIPYVLASAFDDYFYSIIEPSELLKSKVEKNDSIDPKLAKIIHNARSDDNPILFLFKFK